MSYSLPDTLLGKHIRGQIIRSSTSVAANYRAACLAQSKAGFIAKLSVVVEEADKLTALFVSSRKTARNNQQSSIVNCQ